MSHGTIKIIDGVGIYPDDPWTTDEQTATTTTGTASENIATLAIPDDQISIVEVEIAVSCEDSGIRYDSHFTETLRVDKRGGQIESIEVLGGEDRADVNLQALHGQIIAVTADAPTSTDSVTVEIGDAEINPYPLTDDAHNSDVAQRSLVESYARQSDDIDNISTRSLSINRVITEVIEAKSTLSYDLTAPIKLSNEIQPDRSISRSASGGDLEYDSENPTSYGIDLEEVPVKSNPARVAVGPDGTRYWVYTNADESDRIEVRDSSDDFQAATVVSTAAPNLGGGDGRYIIDCLVDDSGTLHVFWGTSTDLMHADNSGGAWSEESVVSYGNPLHLDTTLDADGSTVHIAVSRNIQIGTGQHGPLHHISGTNGSWADNGQVGSIQTKSPRINTDDSGNLGVVVSEETSSGSYFAFYDGTWSSFEEVTSEAGPRSLTFSGGDWYIFRDEAGKSRLSYDYGNPGDWTTNNRLVDGPSGSWIDFVKVLRASDGKIQVLWWTVRARTTHYAYGNKGGFDKRSLIPDAGGWIEGDVGPDGRAYFTSVSRYSTNGRIISVGDPREVELDWKIESEIRHAG